MRNAFKKVRAEILEATLAKCLVFIKMMILSISSLCAIVNLP